MKVDEVGGEVVRFAVRLAGIAVSVPVVAGFVALGAAVIVGRSVRETARLAASIMPWRRESARAANERRAA